MTTLVILDFSGTLSIEAIRFGEPERLTNALITSGLSDLGVDDLALFWNQIVNPFWQVGSRTQMGYQQTLIEGLKGLSSFKIGAIKSNILYSRNEAIASPNFLARLQNSALSFTQQYFQASVIDPAWQSALTQLATDPNYGLIIATDHYAEATPHICQQLHQFGLRGQSILEAIPNKVSSSTVWIANSADLGSHKSEPLFWTRVKQHLPLDQVSQGLLIDDFGANEATADDYAQSQKIDRRLAQTRQLLTDFFGIELTLFKFAPTKPFNQATYLTLIEEAVRFIGL